MMLLERGYSVLLFEKNTEICAALCRTLSVHVGAGRALIVHGEPTAADDRKSSPPGYSIDGVMKKHKLSPLVGIRINRSVDKKALSRGARHTIALYDPRMEIV